VLQEARHRREAGEAAGQRVAAAPRRSVFVIGKEWTVSIEEIGEIARIVRLREDLRKWRKELEGLIVEYIELNRDPQKPVPWRKMARRIGMDHMQLFRIAKRKARVAAERRESGTPTA
jgi:hypothetical protein